MPPYEYDLESQSDRIKKSTKCWQLIEDLGIEGATLTTWRKLVISEQFFKNLFLFLQPIGSKKNRRKLANMEVEPIFEWIEEIILREGLAQQESDKLGVRYEVDHFTLGVSLRKAFRLIKWDTIFHISDTDNPELPHNILKELPRTVYLGRLRRGTSKILWPWEPREMTAEALEEVERHNKSVDQEFPVYLTIQNNTVDFDRVVQLLLERNSLPFILISPTSRFCSGETKQLLWTYKSDFVALTGIVDMWYAERLEIVEKYIERDDIKFGKGRLHIKKEDIFERFHQFHYPHLWEQRTKGWLELFRRKMRERFKKSLKSPWQPVISFIVFIVAWIIAATYWEMYLAYTFYSLFALGIVGYFAHIRWLGVFCTIGGLLWGLSGKDVWESLVVILLGILFFFTIDLRNVGGWLDDI